MNYQSFDDLRVWRRATHGTCSVFAKGLQGAKLGEQLNYDKEIVERHLAHGSDEELRDAYDHTLFLKQRHKMAQEWADYLDGLADQVQAASSG
jgi:hypothetical protein